jgi:hypothetical protein
MSKHRKDISPTGHKSEIEIEILIKFSDKKLIYASSQKHFQFFILCSFQAPLDELHPREIFFFAFPYFVAAKI